MTNTVILLGTISSMEKIHRFNFMAVIINYSLMSIAQMTQGSIAQSICLYPISLYLSLTTGSLIYPNKLLQLLN